MNELHYQSYCAEQEMRQWLEEQEAQAKKAQLIASLKARLPRIINQQAKPEEPATHSVWNGKNRTTRQRKTYIKPTWKGYSSPTVYA